VSSFSDNLLFVFHLWVHYTFSTSWQEAVDQKTQGSNQNYLKDYSNHDQVIEWINSSKWYSMQRKLLYKKFSEDHQGLV
jgi:hypothetical protein